MSDGGIVDGAIAEDDRHCHRGLAIDQHGRPVIAADVVVTLAWGDEHRVIHESRTDGEGRFEACTTDSQGYVDIYDADGGWGRAFMDYEEGIRFPVEVLAAARIRGRVVDERGSPVAGAWLTLVPFRPRRDDPARPQPLDWDDTLGLTGSQEWSTDALGRFDMPVKAGALLALDARADGYARETVGPFAMRAGADHEVEVRLREGAVVSGRVLGDGRPISDAWVSVSSEVDVARDVETDAGGRFVVAALAGDRFTVLARAEGRAPATLRDITAGEHDIELVRDVQLEIRVRIAASLRGCITPQSLFVDVAAGDDSAGGAMLGHTMEGDVLTVVRGELPAGPTRVEVGARYGLHRVRELHTRAGDRRSLDVTLELERDEAILRIAIAEMHPASFRRVLLRPSLEAWWHIDAGGLCTVVPAAEYGISVELVGRRGEGTARLSAGAMTEWTPELRPFVEEPPDWLEDEDAEPRVRTCSPFSMVRVGDALVVSAATAGHPRVWPGDRVLRVDAEVHDLENELLGPEGTEVEVEIERQDGSRAVLRLAREHECD